MPHQDRGQCDVDVVVPPSMARAPLTPSPIRQGSFSTEYLMSLSRPETGRITLTLTTRTIKALRLLALLKGESQNQVAEDLLIAGGLHNAVNSEWSAGKSDQPKPTLTPYRGWSLVFNTTSETHPLRVQMETGGRSSSALVPLRNPSPMDLALHLFG